MGKFTDMVTGMIPAAAGAFLGMATAPWADQRQYEQQERLQRLQIRGQKDMTDYEYKKMLEMWKATNYSAQVEQMENAGLNVGLMYGMGGGGGTTAGGGHGTVGGAQAPVGGNEIRDFAAMGIQGAMMQAQIDVLESQAEKNRADAAKTSGVDTELATTTIGKLKAETTNTEAQTDLTRIETDIARVRDHIAGKTQNQMVAIVEYQSQEAYERLQKLKNDRKISDATWTTAIKAVQAEYVGMLLKNSLTKVQTADTEQSKVLKEKLQALTDKQIWEITERVGMDWDKLTNEMKRTTIMEAMKDLQEDWKPFDAFIDILSEGFDGIFRRGVNDATTPKRNPIGFK